MNDNTAQTLICAMILFLIIICTGDPDILDGIIAILQKYAQ